MKNIVFSLVVLCFSTSSFAQMEMGSWKMFISPNQGVDVINADDEIIAIVEKGLIRYKKKTKEINVWTAANHLSDVSPTAIAYSPETQTIIVGYENGNLDLIHDDEVYNIPAIPDANIAGIKRINKISVKDKNAYLISGVGIVVINLIKKEVRDTYYASSTNKEYLDLTFLNDSIYVLTEDALFGASQHSSFLVDPNQWDSITILSNLIDKGEFSAIESYNNNLFLAFKKDSTWSEDTVYRIQNGVATVFLDKIEFNGLNGKGNPLLISYNGGLKVYSPSLSQIELIYLYNGITYPMPNNACFVDGSYYIIDQQSGLIKAKNSYTSENIGFEGPYTNSAYSVAWKEGKLSIATGGKNGASPSYNRSGGVVVEDGKWTSMTVQNQPMTASGEIWDFLCTAINPADPDIVAYGTSSNIPLVITKKGKVTDTISHFNSLIYNLPGGNWSEIAAMAYDDEGNLWVGNSSAGKPLKVMTASGKWYEMFIGNSAGSKVMNEIIVDENGIKWLGTKGNGLIAFDEGENIQNTADDKYKVINMGTYTGNLPASNVTAIASDFDNNIWIGTPEGMRVLYNSASIFNASPGDYNPQKLLIEFGGYVEIVLGYTHITSIQIDGANRKWIGTAGSGVFLLSPDGLEVIEHFTTADSPLLSDDILDIAINHTNGIVYIVTSKGLIAYRSDASQGNQEYEDVIVFPNPVRPEHSGVITIQGIAYNSDVKITDVSGKVIYKTKSNGGTATWDGRLMNGERAKTGVYLIWTSIDSRDFKGRKVGKVVVLN